eukprot:4212522-Amphidinium_carterae.1
MDDDDGDMDVDDGMADIEQEDAEEEGCAQDADDSVGGKHALTKDAVDEQGADEHEPGKKPKDLPVGEDDDEDPVVQECDVVLNRMHDPPDFIGDMYVLQYPLRPNYRKYGDQGQLEKAEVKPKSGRLRLLYKLAKNDNYEEDGAVGDHRRDRHMLDSVVLQNPDYSFAVGVICEGRLTLTALQAVNQLRPEPPHAEESGGKGVDGDAEGSGHESDENDANVVPEAVRVNIKAAERKDTRQAATSSSA